jgi:uncharacterized protein YjbI with pentapeptide repeats
MTKYGTFLVVALLATLAANFSPAPAARANIYEWEYINPLDHSLGKQPSTILCADGEGVNPVPGASLNTRNLTMAYLIGANLTGTSLNESDLTNAELSQANLTNAVLGGTALTGANLTGAEVRGANFYRFNFVGGISLPQLYSTASYLAHDLTGIRLDNQNLTGVNLAGQNVSNATFYFSTLTGANLSQANATNADFSSGNNVSSDLTGANLSQADLTNAHFAGYVYADESCNECTVPGTNLTNANLSGADSRGADFYLATLAGANTSNLIQSNGHIAGLGLGTGKSLFVRDYDGNPTAGPPTGPLPIVVDQHLAMDATSALRLVFEADPWDSSISFAPGIPVVRGGTLELTFAPGVNLASQLGRTIDLFDWTGVNPTGAFTVSSPYMWNLSKLYTTGEVTLTALTAVPGDFNSNGVVDAADYVVWRKTDGTPAGYNAWRTHFGQPTGNGAGTTANATVPEPATLVLLMFAAAGCYLRRGRSASKVPTSRHRVTLANNPPF